jgi:hypothetical protein
LPHRGAGLSKRKIFGAIGYSKSAQTGCDCSARDEQTLVTCLDESGDLRGKAVELPFVQGVSLD